ncbi:hypothetical protein ONZ43_g3709 [Nemania bipapillata]|uniref:Uncharacterized protein n=1 Tax=Nemania bipapillata TaxID=110536 RepID=A0ACC2IVR3_9PEZI|nr:hypothetical protein ONZ43_g3709 [Nemania bipapillata]
MISNILPVAALAGAAMAACPLSVEITGATGHIAQVAVTNTADEAITVFKGNTVLLDHATKDLLVADAAGNDLPFEGSFVKYRRAGIAPEMFQTIQPGETVSTTVNAATTYRLAGVEEAHVSALQGFHYVTGTTAPTSLKETEFCEATSNTMKITPDQSKVAEEHLLARGEPVFNSRIQKRSVKYSSCTSSQTSTLTTAVADAISMSSKASTAAATAAYYFTTWFRSTSVEAKVQTIYNDVVGVQTTSPTISCTDVYSGCTDGTALLYPSNGFYGFPELATTCADDDYDKGGSILHEFTHLYGTDDYAYGQTAAKKLSAAQAAANADTYEIYAGSVRLGGCSS